MNFLFFFFLLKPGFQKSRYIGCMYQYNCCCQTWLCFSFVCLFICCCCWSCCRFYLFIYFIFFSRNILAEFQWNKNIPPFGSVGFQTLEFLLPFRVVFLVLTGTMSRSCSTGSSRFWTSFANLAWICWDKGRFSFNKNAGLKFRVPYGTVHSGCTDQTQATARLVMKAGFRRSVLGTTILRNGKGKFGPTDRTYRNDRAGQLPSAEKYVNRFLRHSLLWQLRCYCNINRDLKHWRRNGTTTPTGSEVFPREPSGHA